jgi:enoyl-CoA hydratase/carnithine racemase
VNHVFKKEELVEKAVSMAERLAAVNRPAMAETKRLFHEVADLPLDRALEKGRDANRRMRGFGK